MAHDCDDCAARDAQAHRESVQFSRGVTAMLVVITPLMLFGDLLPRWLICGLMVAGVVAAVVGFAWPVKTR